MNVVIARLCFVELFFLRLISFFAWIIKNSLQELTISNVDRNIVFLGEQYTKLFMLKTFTKTALRFCRTFSMVRNHRVQCRLEYRLKKSNKFIAVSILMPFMSTKARKMHTQKQRLHTHSHAK